MFFIGDHHPVDTLGWARGSWKSLQALANEMTRGSRQRTGEKMIIFIMMMLMMMMMMMMIMMIMPMLMRRTRISKILIFEEVQCYMITEYEF